MTSEFLINSVTGQERKEIPVRLLMDNKISSSSYLQSITTF